MELTYKELKELRKTFPKPPDLCQWIRKNVPEYKLKEVKNDLLQYDGYFNVDKAQMIEHCYRGIKNSLKVRYTYIDTQNFVNWLVYLLSPEQKTFDDSIPNMEANLIKLVGEKSFLYNFYQQTKDAESKVKKNDSPIFPYFMFDKATLTWLGSSTMFYYILTSVVYVIEKTVTDKKYKFKEFLDRQEAIASYVISEFTNRDVSSEL